MLLNQCLQSGSTSAALIGEFGRRAEAKASVVIIQLGGRGRNYNGLHPMPLPSTVAMRRLSRSINMHCHAAQSRSTEDLTQTQIFRQT
jgi:hypothetical protein